MPDEPDPSEPNPSARSPEDRRRDVRAGTLLGACSAVGYTVANTALRGVSRPDAFDWSLFVTLCKAVPVAAVAWGLVAYRAARGLPALPPARLWPRLVGAGLLAQLGGNLLFQLALGLGGLALTVPVMFSAIILTGAGLGRFVLGEPVGGRQSASTGLMIAAVFALSLAAPDAAADITGKRDLPTVAAAVAVALATGVSFGTLGVVIRRTAADGVGVSGTLAPIGLAGTLALGTLLLARTGRLPLDECDPATAARLAVAGAANAAAFFGIAAALRRINVVRVNLLNASQAAMCAAVAVLLFDEPATGWLLAGTGLTLAGLVILGARRRGGAEPDAAQNG